MSEVRHERSFLVRLDQPDLYFPEMSKPWATVPLLKMPKTTLVYW